MLATLVLAAMFPFAFFAYKRFEAAFATALTVLAGSLFLPEYFVLVDLPMVPALEKERVTYLAATLAALTYQRDRIWQSRLGAGPESLYFLIVLCFLGTIAFNRLPVLNEGRVYEGVGLYWLFARSLDDFLTLILPFLVGRAMFSSLNDLRVLMYALVGAGLIYLVFISIETLLSIPFRVWQFTQVIYGMGMRPLWRWGMVQPVVFMENGLALASFMAVSAGAACVFVRLRMSDKWFGLSRVRMLLLAGLLMTLNVAGILYGAVMASLIALARSRVVSLAAAIIVGLTCLYPILRMSDVFPVRGLVEVAADFDAYRARSLEGRFEEEEFVLGSIGDRLWFGWGMFDRIPGAVSFGQGETGLDSFWIIRAGLTGVVGVELVFLLLALPVFFAWRRGGLLVGERERLFVGGLMICIAVRMVDFLLNGLWNSLPFFLAGALYGVARGLQPDSKLGDVMVTLRASEAPVTTRRSARTSRRQAANIVDSKSRVRKGERL